LKNIYIRRVLIKRQDMLSFTWRYKTRDIVKNRAPAEGLALVAALLGGDFRAATLFTAAFDLALDTAARTPRGALKKNPPTAQAPATPGHDRAKKRLVEAARPWLHDLGITDAAGNVRKDAQDKFRQINRYVEILAGLIADEKPRRVADMGSGKGYLTFALYDYLAALPGPPPQVTGVEYRTDLVELCNRIARKADLSSLNFTQGTIGGFDGAGVDLLIALHACDTATDDAIAKGIAAGAGLIVVAPCCHKQVRRQMESGAPAAALAPLLRHGIFMERTAEMATDALRALILEYSGYSVKVFEFISDAHTPKNVMIAATKNPGPARRDPALRERIAQAREFFGISRHHLEEIMQESDTP
jgi:SAM-dependent methyltransferase